MEEQQGYTLLETLITILVIAAFSASGLYGWQRWQQQQRLWQIACQVRDYLLQLREDANWRNHDHVISVVRDGISWCFVSSAASQTTYRPVSSLVFTPPWDDVEMAEVTLSLAFLGLRNTAWAGRIRLKNTAGEWHVMVSGWRRIRLCERNEARLCR